MQDRGDSDVNTTPGITKGHDAFDAHQALQADRSLLAGPVVWLSQRTSRRSVIAQTCKVVFAAVGITDRKSVV